MSHMNESCARRLMPAEYTVVIRPYGMSGMTASHLLLDDVILAPLDASLSLSEVYIAHE